MTPTERILRAWTEPGPVPRIHRAAQRALRSSWPTLATALDELAQENGMPQR